MENGTLLMTPDEVVSRAFRQAETAGEPVVGEAAILTAQEKFVRPVLNGLYEPMLGGAYGELLEKFVKPALALYVKLLVMPSLAVQTGAMGVVQVRGNHFQAAADKQRAQALKQIRADAVALMRRAAAHIESAPEQYPEYRPQDNILNRISLGGGMVIEK